MKMMYDRYKRFTEASALHLSSVNPKHKHQAEWCCQRYLLRQPLSAFRVRFSDRRENAVKPKFPKEYYAIARIEGVSDEIVTKYRRLIRHEIYVEKKEQRIRAFSFGDLTDVEYLCPTEEFDCNQPVIKNEALAAALEMLRIANESWYRAIMDYYILDEGISFSDLASRYGVSKTEVYRRVICGRRFLRKHMK